MNIALCIRKYLDIYIQNKYMSVVNLTVNYYFFIIIKKHKKIDFLFYMTNGAVYIYKSNIKH